MALYFIFISIDYQTWSAQIVCSVRSLELDFSHIEVNVVDFDCHFCIVGNILYGTESATDSMRDGPVIRISKSRTVVIAHIHSQRRIVFRPCDTLTVLDSVLSIINREERRTGSNHNRTHGLVFKSLQV